MKTDWRGRAGGAVRAFLADESGPTAVEYAVMLSLILLAVITAVQAFGTQASTSLHNSVTKINEAQSSS